MQQTQQYQLFTNPFPYQYSTGNPKPSFLVDSKIISHIDQMQKVNNDMQSTQ
jgi:hypothetical protein